MGSGIVSCCDVAGSCSGVTSMARKPQIIGYDNKCFELAEHFLSDIVLAEYENDVTEQLAMFIQKEIEDWLNYDLKQYKKKGDD
jgi:hypothetical protein